MLVRYVYDSPSYYRARYYDPSIGRFISEDPIGYDGGINLYGYVGNDPTDFIDPSGWLPKRKDKFYGHNDPHFKKWFHRCWKRSGDADAGRDTMDEAFEVWESLGRPQNGKCGGGNDPCEQKKKRLQQKTMFEIQQEEESARYMEKVWIDVLIGDGALLVVGTAGAFGLLDGAGAGAGGAVMPKPIPIAPPAPAPAPPIALPPAA